VANFLVDNYTGNRCLDLLVVCNILTIRRRDIRTGDVEIEAVKIGRNKEILL